MQLFANLLPLSARKTFWSRRRPICGERTGKRRETARRQIHPASGGQRCDAATTTAKKSDLVGEFNFPIASLGAHPVIAIGRLCPTLLLIHHRSPPDRRKPRIRRRASRHP